jgi:hypothetical protein
MRLFFALALLLTTHAQAASCPFNAAKSNAALRAAVVEFLQPNLSFAWDPASVKVSCARNFGNNPSAVAGCNVTFSAKDGTAFYLHDDVQTLGKDRYGNDVFMDSSDTTMSLVTIERTQATNDEGNYEGPVTCVADTILPYIINRKTGVILRLKMTDFPVVKYGI